MRNLFVLLGFLLLITPTNAGQVINECNDCRVTYVTKKVVKPVKVVRQYVPVAPAPVVMEPVYPIPPGMSVNGPYVSGPVQSPYYVQPVEVAPAPVVVQPVRQPVCAWYVDPYDLFGQLFGEPDLVQSCW